MPVADSVLRQLKPGLTLRLSLKVKEGDRERLQPLEGVVLSIRRGGSPRDATLTLMHTVEGVGVEHVLPLSSPLIANVRILKEAKVRRAKLTYMRKTQRGMKLQERITGSDG
jgi:large subunit ribosomal protein L19